MTKKTLYLNCIKNNCDPRKYGKGTIDNNREPNYIKRKRYHRYGLTRKGGNYFDNFIRSLNKMNNGGIRQPWTRLGRILVRWLERLTGYFYSGNSWPQRVLGNSLANELGTYISSIIEIVNTDAFDIGTMATIVYTCYKIIKWGKKSIEAKKLLDKVNEGASAEEKELLNDIEANVNSKEDAKYMLEKVQVDSNEPTEATSVKRTITEEETTRDVPDAPKKHRKLDMNDKLSLVDFNGDMKKLGIKHRKVRDKQIEKERKENARKKFNEKQTDFLDRVRAIEKAKEDDAARAEEKKMLEEFSSDMKKRGTEFRKQEVNATINDMVNRVVRKNILEDFNSDMKKRASDFREKEVNTTMNNMLDRMDEKEPFIELGRHARNMIREREANKTIESWLDDQVTKVVDEWKREAENSTGEPAFPQSDTTRLDEQTNHAEDTNNTTTETNRPWYHRSLFVNQNNTNTDSGRNGIPSLSYLENNDMGIPPAFFPYSSFYDDFLGKGSGSGLNEKCGSGLFNNKKDKKKFFNKEQFDNYIDGIKNAMKKPISISVSDNNLEEEQRLIDQRFLQSVQDAQPIYDRRFVILDENTQPPADVYPSPAPLMIADHSYNQEEIPTFIIDENTQFPIDISRKDPYLPEFTLVEKKEDLQSKEPINELQVGFPVSNKEYPMVDFDFVKRVENLPITSVKVDPLPSPFQIDKVMNYDITYPTMNPTKEELPFQFSSEVDVSMEPTLTDTYNPMPPVDPFEVNKLYEYYTKDPFMKKIIEENQIKETPAPVQVDPPRVDPIEQGKKDIQVVQQILNTYRGTEKQCNLTEKVKDPEVIESFYGVCELDRNITESYKIASSSTATDSSSFPLVIYDPNKSIEQRVEDADCYGVVVREIVQNDTYIPSAKYMFWEDVYVNARWGIHKAGIFIGAVETFSVLFQKTLNWLDWLPMQHIDSLVSYGANHDYGDSTSANTVAIVSAVMDTAGSLIGFKSSNVTNRAVNMGINLVREYDTLDEVYDMTKTLLNIVLDVEKEKENENEQLRVENTAKKNTIQEKESLINKLTQDNEALTTKNEEQRNYINQLIDEKKELNIDNNEKKGQYEKNKNKIEKLKGSNTRINEKYVASTNENKKLTKENEALTAKTQEQENTIEQLNKEIKDLEGKNIEQKFIIDQTKKSNEELKEEKRKLKERNAQLGKKYVASTKENKELKQVKEALTNKTQEQESTIEQLRNEINDKHIEYKIQVEDYNNQINSLTNNLNDYTSEYDNLVKDYENQILSFNNLYEEYNSACDRVDMVVNQYNQIYESREKYVNENSNLKQQIFELRNELSDKEDQLNRIKAEIKKKEKQILELESKIIDLNVNINQLQKNLDQTNNNLKLLKEENESLYKPPQLEFTPSQTQYIYDPQKQYDDEKKSFLNINSLDFVFEKDIQTLRSKGLLLSSQYDSVKQKLTNLEKDYKKLTNESDQLKEENTTLGKQIKDHEENLEKHQSTINQLRNENQELEGKNIEQKFIIEQTQKENTNLSHENIELKKEKDSLNKDLTEEKQKNEQLESTITKQTSTINEQSKEKEELEKENIEQKFKNDRYKEENKELKEERKQSKERTTKLGKKFVAATKENKELKNKIKQLNQDNLALTTNSKSLTTTINNMEKSLLRKDDEIKKYKREFYAFLHPLEGIKYLSKKLLEKTIFKLMSKYDPSTGALIDLSNNLNGLARMLIRQFPGFSYTTMKGQTSFNDVDRNFKKTRLLTGVTFAVLMAGSFVNGLLNINSQAVTDMILEDTKRMKINRLNNAAMNKTDLPVNSTITDPIVREIANQVKDVEIQEDELDQELKKNQFDHLFRKPDIVPNEKADDYYAYWILWERKRYEKRLIADIQKYKYADPYDTSFWYNDKANVGSNVSELQRRSEEYLERCINDGCTLYDDALVSKSTYNYQEMSEQYLERFNNTTEIVKNAHINILRKSNAMKDIDTFKKQFDYYFVKHGFDLFFKDEGKQLLPWCSKDELIKIGAKLLVTLEDFNKNYLFSIAHSVDTGSDEKGNYYRILISLFRDRDPNNIRDKAVLYKLYSILTYLHTIRVDQEKRKTFDQI